MEPWQSWMLVGAVAAGAGYYYTTTGPKKRSRGRGAGALDANIQSSSKNRNDSKDKRGKEKDSAASDQVSSDVADNPSSANKASGKKKKNNKKTTSKLAHSTAVDIEPKQDLKADDDDNDGVDDLKFAQQLNNAQVGTSLKASNGVKDAPKGKKNKRKKPQETFDAPNGHPKESEKTQDAQEMSRTSSATGGADADDDLSGANSPDFSAVSIDKSAGGGVADMLEAPAKGPSVLRLTEPVNASPNGQVKPKKAAAEPETKKQRQHRKKREEQKAIREETEKERRVLLEKQRRTAREAEGRPPKNGLSTSQAPTQNAWKSSASVDGVATNPPVKINPQPLLDTFDDNQSTATSSGTGANGTLSDKHSFQDLPSEEEQLRILSEMDSDNAWSTVDKSGKAKNKSKSSSAHPPHHDNSHTDNMKPAATPTPAKQVSQNKDTTVANEGDKPTISDNEAPSEADLVSSKIESVDLSEAKSTSVADPKETSDDTAEVVAETSGARTDGKADKKATNEDKIDDPEPIFDCAGYNPAVRFNWPWQHDSKEHATFIARNYWVRRHIDRSIWNHDNIHEHPDFNHLWPYALLGHPQDSDWGPGWDAIWPLGNEPRLPPPEL